MKKENYSRKFCRNYLALLIEILKNKNARYLHISRFNKEYELEINNYELEKRN